jgi:hypothetical protein
MRQHFHAARRGSQSAYKAKTATHDCNQRVPSSPRALTFQTRHSKGRLFRRTTRDVARGKRHSIHPRRSPRFHFGGEAAGVVLSREAADFLFARLIFSNCEVGKAGGVTGARRAKADIDRTISDGSE